MDNRELIKNKVMANMTNEDLHNLAESSRCFDEQFKKEEYEIRNVYQGVDPIPLGCCGGMCIKRMPKIKKKRNKVKHGYRKGGKK